MGGVPMKKAVVIEKAKALLEQIHGDEVEILIRLELWNLLNQDFCEDIEDVESWHKGDIISDILAVLQQHFTERVRIIQANRDAQREYNEKQPTDVRDI